MKILYAAGDREGAEIQLTRFLNATSKKNYNIKIAAYHKSNFDLSVDWNLESLKDIYSPSNLIFNSEKLKTYYEQVRYFDPDLIISDLEIYTSYIATILNKKIWQVSPNIIHYATPHKEKIAIGLYKLYPHLFHQSALFERIKNIIFNADRKMVYSHFGDTNVFNLVNEFEWVRPYHVSGKRSLPCEHNVTACTFHNNKKFIDYLKKYKDTVLFSNFIYEKYDNVILKDIADQSEYECNLKNCNFFLSQGHADFLADAFYNGKYSIIMPNFQEQECITNALYSKFANLGTVVYNNDFIETKLSTHEVNLNPTIKYLHEHIENL